MSNLVMGFIKEDTGKQYINISYRCIFFYLSLFQNEVAISPTPILSNFTVSKLLGQATSACWDSKQVRVQCDSPWNNKPCFVLQCCKQQVSEIMINKTLFVAL